MKQTRAATRFARVFAHLSAIVSGNNIFYHLRSSDEQNGTTVPENSQNLGSPRSRRPAAEQNDRGEPAGDPEELPGLDGLTRTKDGPCASQATSPQGGTETPRAPDHRVEEVRTPTVVMPAPDRRRHDRRPRSRLTNGIRGRREDPSDPGRNGRDRPLPSSVRQDRMQAWITFLYRSDEVEPFAHGPGWSRSPGGRGRGQPPRRDQP